MHRIHPRVRGGLVARSTSLVLGLFLFACGIVLILESRLGLAPWDVWHQGLAKHTPLTFGWANVVTGLAVLGLAALLGGTIGPGTVANAVLIGVFVEAITRIPGVGELSHSALGARSVLLLAGIEAIGIATAFYVGADFGAGPRDTLMLVVSRRAHVRVGVARGTIELAALVAGLALGGSFGVGTIAFAVLVGPAVETSFAALARSPLAASTEAVTPVVVGE
jgi:uncharacterized membrane protein YczE